MKIRKRGRKYGNTIQLEQSALPAGGERRRQGDIGMGLPVKIIGKARFSLFGMDGWMD